MSKKLLYREDQQASKKSIRKRNISSCDNLWNLIYNILLFVSIIYHYVWFEWFKECFVLMKILLYLVLVTPTPTILALVLIITDFHYLGITESIVVKP